MVVVEGGFGVNGGVSGGVEEKLGRLRREG
jgi:hypothetical protein